MTRTTNLQIGVNEKYTLIYYYYVNYKAVESVHPAVSYKLFTSAYISLNVLIKFSISRLYSIFEDITSCLSTVIILGGVVGIKYTNKL